MIIALLAAALALPLRALPYDDAKAAYAKAWKAMDATVGYRRLIDAKLTALGAAPVDPAASAGSAQ